jgi:hypothetical protein
MTLYKKIIISKGFILGTHWKGGWVSPRTVLVVVEKRNVLPCPESNPGCPARSPSRRHGHWSDKNTRCISASRPDRFTPGERAPGTHFILLQFGLTCPIYCRFRGVFLNANNSYNRPRGLHFCCLKWPHVGRQMTFYNCSPY